LGGLVGVPTKHTECVERLDFGFGDSSFAEQLLLLLLLKVIILLVEASAKSIHEGSSSAWESRIQRGGKGRGHRRGVSMVNGETLFALLQIDSAGSAVQERGSFVGLGGGERKGKTQAAEGECRRERGDQEGAGVERNGEDGGDWRERVVGGHYENWLI
jgi:hypothetical protein